MTVNEVESICRVNLQHSCNWWSGADADHDCCLSVKRVLLGWECVGRVARPRSVCVVTTWPVAAKISLQIGWERAAPGWPAMTKQLPYHITLYQRGIVWLLMCHGSSWTTLPHFPLLQLLLMNFQTQPISPAWLMLRCHGHGWYQHLYEIATRNLHLLNVTLVED